MNIPEDIKAYIKKKNKTVIIKWLVTTLIAAALIVLCNESFHYIPTEAKIASYITILLIPAFIFRLPKLIFDRSWEGTVIKSSCQEVIESDHKIAPKLSTLQREISINLDILLENGDIKTLDVRLGSYNTNSVSLISHYKEGSKIIHIKGTDHYQVISSSGVGCVVCGYVNGKGRKTCAQCMHTLNTK